MIEASYITIRSQTRTRHFFRLENAAGVRVDCCLSSPREVQDLKDSLNKTLNLMMAEMLEEERKRL